MTQIFRFILLNRIFHWQSIQRKKMFEINEKNKLILNIIIGNFFGQSAKKSSYLITSYESNAVAEAILKRYKYLLLVSFFCHSSRFGDRLTKQ